jgi:hypothetical protein
MHFIYTYLTLLLGSLLQATSFLNDAHPMSMPFTSFNSILFVSFHTHTASAPLSFLTTGQYPQLARWPTLQRPNCHTVVRCWHNTTNNNIIACNSSRRFNNNHTIDHRGIDTLLHPTLPLVVVVVLGAAIVALLTMCQPKLETKNTDLDRPDDTHRGRIDTRIKYRTYGMHGMDRMQGMYRMYRMQGMYGMYRSNGNEKRQGTEHRKSLKRTKRSTTTATTTTTTTTTTFHLLLVLSVLAANGTTALAPLSASEESSTGLLSSVQFMSFDMPFDAGNATCLSDLASTTATAASVDLQSTTDRAVAVAVRAFVEALLERRPTDHHRDHHDNRFVVKMGWAPLFLLPLVDEQRLSVQRQWRARLRNRDLVHPVVVKSWYDSSNMGGWNVYHQGIAPIDGRHSELVGCQEHHHPQQHPSLDDDPLDPLDPLPLVIPGSVVTCHLVVRDTFGDRAPLLVHERRRVDDLPSTFQVVLHADGAVR